MQGPIAKASEGVGDLEGEVGEFLLNKITEKSNVRGMAFTYSGGFRNVLSSKKVSTLKDLTDEDQN